MRKLILLLVIIIAALTSCKKLYNPLTHRDDLVGFKLAKDSLTMYVGQKSQIPVVTNPSTYPLDSLKWSSSDTTTVSISNTGLVTALKVGKSTVSITNLSGTLAITGLVTVLPAKPDSLGVGLLAFYPFNNSAADSSGHGYNGTVYGATSTTDRFGNANSAYYFNGISSYITVDDAVPLRLNNTDFTINYWVYLKRYDYSSGTALITKNSGAGQQGWNCSIVGLANYDGAAVGNAFFGESGGTDPFAISTAQLDTAKWYMITIIYQLNKGKISFYINSVYDSSVLNMPTPNPATTAKMHFGNNSLLDIEPGGAPGYFLKGELDGIRIYSRRLNVTEINYLYSSTSD